MKFRPPSSIYNIIASLNSNWQLTASWTLIVHVKVHVVKNWDLKLIDWDEIWMKPITMNIQHVHSNRWFIYMDM